MGAHVRIVSFGGMAPRKDARTLMASEAQVATNLIVTSETIKPYRGLRAINAPLVPNAISLFRMNGASGERWLSWATDVDVARGPVPGDTSQRIYFTGDGEPRMSNYALAASGSGPYPGSFFVLGVFRPATAPSVSVSGGSGLDVTRVYRRTFVTPFGEESAPSPVHAGVTGKANGTWALTGLGVPPGNTFTVTGASWSAGTATLTVSSTYGLRKGEQVTVAGVSPTGYNGKVTLTAVTSGSISYAVASNPGAYSSGGTITRVAAHNLAGGTQRIYRTVVSSGITKFRFVVEIPIATTAYDDTLLDAATGEELRSELWEMPPTDMRGIVQLPNGVMAGFAGNELILSEANQPHAYNPANRKIAVTDIVGIGFVGNTLVVGTKGNPYRAMGTFPDAVEWIRDPAQYPCLSKRSLVSMPYGVIYASDVGLIFCDGSAFAVSSQPFYTEREWKLLMPQTMIAAVHANRYYCRYSTGGSTGAMIIMDRTEPAALLAATLNPDELYSDPETGSLYVLDEGIVQEWDAEQSERLLFDWWSKEFVIPTPANMGWVKVDADFGQDDAAEAAAEAAFNAVVAANLAKIAALKAGGALNAAPLNSVAINGSLLQALPPKAFDILNFTLYAGGKVRAVRVIDDVEPKRLPTGYKADTFSLRISGNVPVRSIVVGETIDDLKAV